MARTPQSPDEDAPPSASTATGGTPGGIPSVTSDGTPSAAATPRASTATGGTPGGIPSAARGGTPRAGATPRVSAALGASPSVTPRAGGSPRAGTAGRGGAAPDGGSGASGSRTRRPLLVVALTLAVLAAVAAALSGWAWYGAAHDGDADFARTRDTVLAAGEQAVQNLNTLDHADLDHGLDIWESSTTGDLHTQLAQGRDDFAKQVRQAQTTSTAKVLSGAVTELDTRTGKAAVMVALRITVQAPKAQPAVKESRMLGELTRTADGWKLSALGQAPMGDGAAGPATTGSATATPAAPTTPQPTASR